MNVLNFFFTHGIWSWVLLFLVIFVIAVVMTLAFMSAAYFEEDSCNGNNKNKDWW